MITPTIPPTIHPTKLASELEEVLRSRRYKRDPLRMIHELSKQTNTEYRSRGGLRISSIGKHPIVASIVMALVAEDEKITDEDHKQYMEHYVTESGDMFELWVLGKLSTYDKVTDKRFKLFNDVGKVVWAYGEGQQDFITGHPDVVVEINGRTIVLDVKHTNSKVERSLLRPKLTISAKTGNDIKVSNEFESLLSDWALEDDDRGYIVQDCCYAEALQQRFDRPVDAGLIIHVKDTGKTHVVHIPDEVRQRALTIAKNNIESLKQVIDLINNGPEMTLSDRIAEVTAIVGAPRLTPATHRGNPTGIYYTPLIMRSFDECILDLIYGGYCGGGYEVNPQWDGVELKTKYRPVPTAPSKPVFRVVEFPEVS